VRGLLVLLLLTTACQRKSNVPTCDVMADHVQTMFEPVDDFAKSVRSVFAKRCTDDAWSDEMRTCVGDTKSLVEPQNCKRKLLPEQQKKLEADLQQVELRETRKILPPVCGRYEQVLGLVLACDKLPQNVRDDLAARFRAAKAEWATMVDKSELGPVCSNGIRVLKQAAVECPNSEKW
jgi:hypothetical protein